MALVAFLTLLTLVDIIVFMTVDAPCLQFVLAQISLMTVVAGYLPVRPHDFKLRVLVMIETNRSPQRRLMALFALRSKPALVNVIILVTTNAHFFHLY